MGPLNSLTNSYVVIGLKTCIKEDLGIKEIAGKYIVSEVYNERGQKNE